MHIHTNLCIKFQQAKWNPKSSFIFRSSHVKKPCIRFKHFIIETVYYLFCILCDWCSAYWIIGTQKRPDENEWMDWCINLQSRSMEVWASNTAWEKQESFGAPIWRKRLLGWKSEEAHFLQKEHQIKRFTRLCREQVISFEWSTRSIEGLSKGEVNSWRLFSHSFKWAWIEAIFKDSTAFFETLF